MNRVFLGEFSYSIDKQRRVAVPSEWREDGDAPVVYYCLPGRENTVQVMPKAQFMEEVFEKVKSISFADKNRTLAKLGRFGHETVCDKQGRICLSPLLTNHAGLELPGPVLVTGTVHGFEIRRVDESEDLAGSIDSFLDEIEAIQTNAKGGEA